MIVVIGLPVYTDEEGELCAGGLAVEIGAEARRRGSQVELAGKVGGDGPGDAVVVALSRMGVGHAALLRDPARPTPLLVAGPEGAEGTEGAVGAESAAAGAAAQVIPVDPDQADAPGEPSPESFRLLPEDPAARPGLEAGDIQMALRYLTGPAVVVVAENLGEAALAAAVEGAAFSQARLIVLTDSETGSFVGIPDSATVLERPVVDDGSFARLVGTFAASLDAGNDPARAFRDGVSAAGWEPSAD